MLFQLNIKVTGERQCLLSNIHRHSLNFRYMILSPPLKSKSNRESWGVPWIIWLRLKFKNLLKEITKDSPVELHQKHLFQLSSQFWSPPMWVYGPPHPALQRSLEKGRQKVNTKQINSIISNKHPGGSFIYWTPNFVTTNNTIREHIIQLISTNIQTPN